MIFKYLEITARVEIANKAIEYKILREPKDYVAFLNGEFSDRATEELLLAIMEKENE